MAVQYVSAFRGHRNNLLDFLLLYTNHSELMRYICSILDAEVAQAADPPVEVPVASHAVSSVGLAPYAVLWETLQTELGELRQAHTTCKKRKLDDHADDVDLSIEALPPTHGQKNWVKSARLCPMEACTG